MLIYSKDYSTEVIISIYTTIWMVSKLKPKKTPSWQKVSVIETAYDRSQNSKTGIMMMLAILLLLPAGMIFVRLLFSKIKNIRCANKIILNPQNYLYSTDSVMTQNIIKCPSTANLQTYYCIFFIYCTGIVAKNFFRNTTNG